ncbi:hypothetical protein V1525DRAFT_406613 [Lipomyces kononenkoae]|uniref:Uncharacterized protein n=1 Tax=Lipomyces kononenkoae TaxID=34357 RepID=A0ACC3SY37_LIPKO
MDTSRPVNNPELLFTFPGTGISEKESLTARKRKLPHAIRRHRVIRSCVNCHRRKVKCDKLTPACQNCVKLDLECQYYDNINDDLDILDELAPSAEGQEETDVDDAGRQRDDGSSGSPDQQELKNGVRRVNVGYLSVDPTTGGSRYTNGAFWGAYFKEMADTNSLLQSQNTAYSIDSIVQNETAASLMLSYYVSNPKAGMEILCSIIPEKSVADGLVEHYFFAVHPAIPILNRYKFMETYESFWVDFQNKSPVDRLFLPLLFVTLYGATLSICESSMFDIFSSPNEIITMGDAFERQKQNDASSREQRVLQNKYKLATEISLSVVHFPAQPSLQGLQTSVILNTSTTFHQSDSGTGNIAMLIRTAQMMGLHRDPSNFSVVLEPEDAQERRLIWWQLVHLDYASSMWQGLPPIVHRLENDVKLPSECVIANGKEDKDQVDCPVLMMNAISEGSLLNCMILLTAYGVKKCSIQQISALDEEILRVRPRIEARCRKLMLLKDSDMRGNMFKDWAFYMMHIVHEKAYTYLHHPNYLKDENINRKTPGQTEPSVRQNVLKAAVNTLYYYLGFSKMPDFVVYVWYIRFLQPYHAIIIVLQDLYLNEPVLPESGSTYIEDERLRVVEQVFQVLHLLRITEKSAVICHAWHSINKLRTGTWLKIGYLHPVGLPLVSRNLPPEYANLAPSSEEDHPAHTGTTLEALIQQQSCTTSDKSTTGDFVPPLSPNFEQLMTQSANVLAASDGDTYAGTRAEFANVTSLERPDQVTTGSGSCDLSSVHSSSSSSPNSILATVASNVSNTSSSPELLNSLAPESNLRYGPDVSDRRSAADEDTYDEYYKFAAQMENVDSWDRWDMLLKL